MTTLLPLLLILLSSGVSTRPEGGRVSRSSGGEQMVPDPAVTQQMREFKTEVIKSRILSEVNMMEPPSIAAPLQLPQNLINLFFNKEMDDSILGEGENLIAYPLNENISCGNDPLCSRFEFELPSDNQAMASIHVWIQKANPSSPLSVHYAYESDSSWNSSDEGRRKFREKLREVKSDQGWSIYEMPSRFVLDSKSDQFCEIEVLGLSKEDYADHKPFIVANMNPAAAERKRRSTNSSSSKNCTCCLVDFYVSFKEIGWHWVVAPLGFNANMCYGKCSNQINSYPSHYHRMLSTILNNKTTPITEKKEDLWTPCCSPTKLRPLNMIYVAGNNTATNSTSSFIYHKIPDMITESCGCW